METTENLDALLAEAEEKGYKRGLNEQIEARMKTPAEWENPSPDPSPDAYSILSNPRPSIWDD